jgi:hypothetical protein
VLPPPEHPLFLKHDPQFDNYKDSPMEDALLPYPEECGYGVPEFSMVDRHRTFVDYGFRVFARFAHLFYWAAPVMVPDHICPVGTASDYTPSSCVQRTPPPSFLSRVFSGGDTIRSVGTATSTTVEDFVVMGAQEILEAAGSDVSSRACHEIFVRGRHPVSGKFIKVDLERDHVPQTVENGNLKISEEIDSFIFVGQRIRVLKAVKLYVTVAISKDPPIRIHNHVYVNLRLPPSLKERLRDDFSFDEKEFRLYQIPHMYFADLGDGVYVYIFFPRATHHKWSSRFKDGCISYVDQHFFLDRVALPALRANVSANELSRYGYDAEGFNQKTTTQTYTTGNKGTPKGLLVKPEVFHAIQESMRQIVNDDLDGSLAPYGSFFFAMEAKGIGLASSVDNMDLSSPGQPLENLINQFSKIDFDFLMDRNNGESYFDIALGIHPVTPLVGFMRLDALEASFGAAGFLCGKQFPLNTFGYYGSMQAEMARGRREQTHIVHRSSYLSFYNLARNFDNRPWGPPLDEAYHCSQHYRDIWRSRMDQYQKMESKQQGYGVRDEYRVGGLAVRPFLNAATEKVNFSDPL